MTLVDMIYSYDRRLTAKMSEKFQTRAVLGGYYRGGRANLKALHTHLLNVETDRVSCGSIPADHLADEFADDTTARPTCPRCAKAWDKLQG